MTIARVIAYCILFTFAAFIGLAVCICAACLSSLFPLIP